MPDVCAGRARRANRNKRCSRSSGGAVGAVGQQSVWGQAGVAVANTGPAGASFPGAPRAQLCPGFVQRLASLVLCSGTGFRCRCSLSSSPRQGCPGRGCSGCRALLSLLSVIRN